MLRHGTHVVALAASLEAGAPKGSTVAGEHEFTIPGIYTCRDGQLAPLDYAITARIAMHHVEGFGDNQSPWVLPWTQFVCRGEETIEDAKSRFIKPFGGDQQYIYLANYNVIWTELQVWIGIATTEKIEAGVYACAPCFDGARRCPRLRKVDMWNPAGLSSTTFKDVTSTSEIPFPVLSSEDSAATMPPEGW